MKRKNLAIILISVALILNFAIPAAACSSFVVYTNETIYGMNYDWMPNEYKMAVEKINDLKYFILRFSHQGRGATVACMNSNGLFGNYQSVAAIKQNLPEGAETIPLYKVWGAALAQKEKVKGVEEIIGDKIVTPNPGWFLHCMFADKYGDKIILEVIEDGHKIIRNDKNFMVMTNYYISRFDDPNFFGCHRFEAAYKKVEEHMGAFDLEKAFDVLKACQQYSTRVSMVFFPEKLEVYVALERNFDRIWKIDIMAETIETFRGFENYKKVSIADPGLTRSELLEWK